MYILPKNEPYCDPVWGVIHPRPDVGVVDVCHYLVNNDLSCCLEGGSLKKGSISAQAAEGCDRIQIVDNFFRVSPAWRLHFRGEFLYEHLHREDNEYDTTPLSEVSIQSKLTHIVDVFINAYEY